MTALPITTLFLDIGGVLLTNGWDTALRKKTAEHFRIDFEEMSSRHHLIYDTYETGKMTLEEYFNQTVFYEKRDFSFDELKQFILEQARPFTETIEYIRKLKRAFELRVAVVSNEGREIAIDRIERFHLREFVDFFIVSAFVHLRKPDLDIYRLALDVAQVRPEQVAYLDDRPLLVENACQLGIKGILHTGTDNTRSQLAALGLSL